MNKRWPPQSDKQAEIDDLIDENVQLKAKLKKCRKAFYKQQEGIPNIQAQAIEEFYNKHKTDDPGQFFWPQTLLDYAKQLRANAEENSNEKDN